MDVVAWEDGYVLGIDEIDEHHKHLVDLINRSYNANDLLHNRDKIEKIFSELVKYTEYHFNSEELMMRKLGYSKIDSHIAEHAYFKDKLNELLNNLLYRDVWVDTQLISYLGVWLLNHIAYEDKDFANYAKANY